jgi:hypothetical protein
MGTSFVNIGENGFWMLDSVLEVWLRLLSLHIEDPGGNDSENEKLLKSEIRNDCLLQSRGYFIGSITVDLDNYIKSNEGKIIILKAINSFLKVLSEAPDTLSKDVINILGIEGLFQKDFETWRLIEVGNAFIRLINNQINYTVKDTSFMPGCSDKINNNL